MKKITLLPLFFLLFIILFFFHSFFLQGKLPIPSDTIVGLYHPFRDLYAKTYPNGIPYKNYLITDPVRQQYPWRFLAVSVEKTGQLPLWNPYSFAGTPLLANFQTAAFYPLNILLFVFPFSIGWSLLILLGQLLAGVFMYWYLSNLRLTYYARFLGSIVYVFCGFMTAWLEWGTLDQIAVWIPLLLLSIDKIFVTYEQTRIKKQHIELTNKRFYVWPLLFFLALICVFFAGHLQPFFYFSFIVGCYFVARWFQFGKQKNVLFLFSLLVVGFLLITAEQWIPTIQFIVQSARNADQLDAWKQAGWFIPWQNLVQFVAPDFFGNPATLNYWGVWNYGEFIGYVGLFPLIMAIFAMFYRFDRKTLFFSIFFFLSLIFSLPSIFAQIPYIFHIPFFETSQPTRLLFITDFSLSILCALGLDFFLRSNNKKNIVYPLLFILFVYAALWYFALSGYKLLHINYDFVTVTKHNLYFPTAVFFLIILFLACFMFIKQPKIRNVCVVILLIISTVDLFRFSDKFIPFTQSSYLYPSDRALTYLQNQQGTFRIMTTDSEVLPPNFSIMYHLQSLDGYDPLYLMRYGELMAAIGRNKPNIKPPFGFNRIITLTNAHSRLIDLLGVKYVMSLSDLHESKLTKVFSEGQTRLYKNNSAYPRAFFVTQIKVAASKQEAIDSLFDPTVDLHTTAVVEGWDQQQTQFSKASASIVDYKENLVTVRAKTDSAAFLVLTDTFYPTWHVTVDGKEQKIYRTDYNFRGIILPKGNHLVIFSDRLL